MNIRLYCSHLVSLLVYDDDERAETVGIFMWKNGDIEVRSYSCMDNARSVYGAMLARNKLPPARYYNLGG